MSHLLQKGIKKALDTGSKCPLLVVNGDGYEHGAMVAVLGALEALYVPLEMREQVPSRAIKANQIGVIVDSSNKSLEMNLIEALEAGRIVSRSVD